MKSVLELVINIDIDRSYSTQREGTFFGAFSGDLNMVQIMQQVVTKQHTLFTFTRVHKLAKMKAIHSKLTGGTRTHDTARTITAM